MEEFIDVDMGDCSEDKIVFILMRMEQLIREYDVYFYIGLNGIVVFNVLFDFVVKKVVIMNYWKGEKNLKLKINKKFEVYFKCLNVIFFQLCEDIGFLRCGLFRKLILE